MDTMVLLNAPTGSGKTYAVWLACLLECLNHKRRKRACRCSGSHLFALYPTISLWLLQKAAGEMGTGWEIGVRTGDTPQGIRKKQVGKMPECLITTPESLHVLLSHKNAGAYFRELKAIIVDEWHELLGTKRGVQIELALSKLKTIPPDQPKIWAISATIGNLEEALDVLLGPGYGGKKIIIKADIEKKIAIETIIPDIIEKYPWAGHLGIRLLPQVLPVLRNSSTTLLFTNTRSQTEIWYREILNSAPDLAGVMAMHHGSLDNNVRKWVEEALQAGKLKLVVCTSSLDLGVDFRPVETIIQVGGPKGVSRFMQRAGRSGHQPGALSRIYFVPTHSLELVEGAALKTAIGKEIHENRVPLKRSLDVLVQYLVTLSVGDGFLPDQTLRSVRSTAAYANLTDAEWQWCLNFITTGGKSLRSYDEFSKVVVSDGLYRVDNRRTSARHRLSIGTIVEDPVLRVKYTSGRTDRYH